MKTKVLCALLLLVVGGCVSIPTSPTPRFYSLQAMDVSHEHEKFVIPEGVIIGLGPVKVPEYQNRPQIVTQDKAGIVRFAEFDRWSESLDRALGRVIVENLTAMLPGAAVKAYPWHSAIPVKYCVIVDVIRLESSMDSGLSFAAQWSVIDEEDEKMLLIRRSDFHEPIEPAGYPGIIKALNKVCVSFSKDIARELSILAEKPKE